MEIINFIVLPLTGMIIGFLTNWIAIKFLFWPRQKTFGIQGLIPKRKDKIAAKIASSSLQILPQKIEKLTKMPYIGEKIVNYIEKEVSDKIKSMDNKQLQKIIENTSKKEMRFIVFSGALLGFIIGLIQAIILGLL